MSRLLRVLALAAGLVVLLVLVVVCVAVAGGVPGWAWLVAGCFWSVVFARRRLRHRLGDDDAGAAVEDGPRWSPFRNRGF